MANGWVVRGCSALWCVLAAAVLAGCGGGGHGALGLTRSTADVTLVLQTSSIAEFGEADSITLVQHRGDDELVCEITASGAHELKGLFCELEFNPERLTPIQAEATHELGAPDETLVLSAMQRGRLMLAQARIHPASSPGFCGDGVLAKVRFALQPYNERFAAGITCRAGVSNAPISSRSESLASWNSETSTLVWDYASQGDYDQNSEVGSPDIAPLAMHYHESAAPDKFERQTVQSVIDGDNNGELGSADLVPIAQNFGNIIQGYNIYASTVAGDYPASATAESTIDPLDSVLRTTAVGAPLEGRLTYSFDPGALPAGTRLWVRPYHGEHEGIPSNQVDAPASGPTLTLATDPDEGIGTEADPYVVDTDTQYQFNVADPGAGDVTTNELTEYTVSDMAAGAIANTNGILDITDGYTGDFTVSATYDSQAATPVLYFRVVNLLDNPILTFNNPPASGLGVASDPYIVDTTTIYMFDVFFVIGGSVSAHADTNWTVSEEAAGSVVKGSPASLNIDDSYTGTFTVGATHKSVGSLPAVFYLRVPEAGTPQFSLAEPPANGEGTDFDPYEVDAGTDFELNLVVDGTGDVGTDTATAWTVDPSAAGTVNTSGAKASLEIEDSYDGLFSVTPLHNGTASVPDAIYFDPIPTGLADPPVADLQITPSTTTEDPNTEFTCDASGSTATVGNIAFYSWDWSGDGTWEISETDSHTLTHSFGYTGVFNVTVRVTDDRGATDTASVQVTVTDGGNFDPTASLVAEIDGSGDWQQAITSEVPITINYDASASSDPDGPIDHYDWDLDGDGNFTDATTTTGTHSFTFSNDGIYYPGVKVYDGDGAVDTEFVELTLTQAGGNITPIASLEAAPTYGLPPLSVDFDASNSSDPLGDQLSYEWDWNGDGTYDHDSGNTSTANHEYNAAGNYTAVVKVSDAGGLFDTESVAITVDDGVAEWHFYDVVVPDDVEIESCGEYCSMAVVDGQPAIVFSADIPNATYSPQAMMYIRATDANGTAWGEPVNVEYPTSGYNEYGYQPEIEIIDGIPVVAYSAHVWSGSSWYYAVYASTAQDAQGSAWGNPVKVAGSTSNNASLHMDMGVVNGTAAVVYYSAGDNTLQYRRATDTAGATWDPAVTVDTFTFSGTPQTVDPTLMVVNGHPAAAYFFYMNDINADELHYTRATDATGSAWGSPAALSTDNGCGWFNTLLFSGGVPLLGTVDNSEYDHSKLTLMRGANADGTSWNSPVLVHDVVSAMFDWKDIQSAKMAIINGMPSFAYYVEEAMGAANLHYIQANAADGSSWQGTQNLGTGISFMAYELSLVEVNNHPAIAFCGDVTVGTDSVNGLRYAVYY